MFNSIAVLLVLCASTADPVEYVEIGLVSLPIWQESLTIRVDIERGHVFESDAVYSLKECGDPGDRCLAWANVWISGSLDASVIDDFCAEIDGEDLCVKRTMANGKVQYVGFFDEYCGLVAFGESYDGGEAFRSFFVTNGTKGLFSESGCELRREAPWDGFFKRLARSSREGK